MKLINITMKNKEPKGNGTISWAVQEKVGGACGVSLNRRRFTVSWLRLFRAFSRTFHIRTRPSVFFLFVCLILLLIFHSAVWNGDVTPVSSGLIGF